MISFNIVLFNGFETLDAFGPAEMIGKMPKNYRLGYFSMNGGAAISSQQASVNTLPFSEMDTGGILLIPGGMGTRKLVDDIDFIAQIKALSQKALYVLTVCTGSALLAKTGLLRGRKATSNKRAFDWVCGNGVDVRWMKKARWVSDDKFYTSSGVSAGVDMILGFIRDVHDEETAQNVCRRVEYIWNRDPTDDPFALT